MLDIPFRRKLPSGYIGGQRTLRARIAIVEDEPDLRDAVAEYLSANGYEVGAFEDAASLRAAAEVESFDLAILDIAMPGEDGLSLARWLRAHSPVGIIFATAAGTALDRIVGLELGADDYMVKPYELREMLARVRSVLRRLPLADDQPLPLAAGDSPARRVVRFGSFSTDLDSRVLTGPDGSVVELARSEFDVLEVFLTRANRLLSRAALSEAIGLDEEPETSRAIDIRVMRLRKKIEADPANPKFLRTVRGEGYIFSLPDGGR